MKTRKKCMRAAIVITWLVLAVSDASAQNWLLASTFTNSIGGHLTSLAMSADGKKLATVLSVIPDFPASVPHSTVYLSTDSGATWSDDLELSWTYGGKVAFSADGTKLTVLLESSDSFNTPQHFVSGYVSMDSGTNWAVRGGPIGLISSVACSANGEALVAIGDATYTSAGLSGLWTTNTELGWSVGGCAISADGRKLAVTTYNDIYISTNCGTDWASAGVGSGLWAQVAMSADGTKLIAVGGPEAAVYVSTNTGAFWSEAIAPSLIGQVPNWFSVASSADGRKLIASEWPGQLFTSSDGGATWVSSNLPHTNWMQVAVSADGGTLAAIDIDGSVYTSQTTVRPQLDFCFNTNAALLSWGIPSTDYLLEQSGDLVNWSTLTNIPVLNLTNLQNEARLRMGDDRMFFRLRSP